MQFPFPILTTTTTNHPPTIMRNTSSKITLFLLILLSLQNRCDSFMVGRRKIKCTTPIGGDKDKDILLDAKQNFSVLLGYVGIQAALPSLGQCPKSVQIQPPWFNGAGGGGICPPEYYSLAAVIPGLVLFGAALVLSKNIDSNRLLVTTKGLGTIDSKVDIGVEKQPEEILFKDVEEWNMTPFGLFVKHSSETSFFPLFWDSKDVEAMLADRV